LSSLVSTIDQAVAVMPACSQTRNLWAVDVAAINDDVEMISTKNLFGRFLRRVTLLKYNHRSTGGLCDVRFDIELQAFLRIAR
jgi:hypothetical protein